jgi:NAD/NADP transhydrogenase alpha subunit
VYLEHLQLAHRIFACLSHSVLLVVVPKLSSSSSSSSSFLQGGAGEGSMFSDALYAAAGAEIVSAEEAWKQQVLYTSPAYGGRSEMRVSCRNHSVVSLQTDKH